MQQITAITQLPPSSQLHCINNKKAQLICCQNQCSKPALICLNGQCNCFKSNHKRCKFLNINAIAETINKKRQRLPEQIKKAIDQLVKIYSDMIDQLSKDRQSMQIWEQNYGLTARQYQLLSKLNMNIGTDAITGDFVSSVSFNIKTRSQYSNFTSNWVKQTWRQYKSNFNKMIGKFHLSFDGFQMQNFEQATLSQQFQSSNVRNIVDQNLLIQRARKQNWTEVINWIDSGVNSTNIGNLNILRLLGSNSNKNQQWRNMSNDLNSFPQEIRALKQLHQLCLNGHNIRKIQNLSALVNLRILNLAHNKIQKIRGLNKLASLEILYLHMNKITKIQYLSDIPKLQYVSLWDNPAIQSVKGKVSITEKQGQTQNLSKRNVKVILTFG